MICRYIALFVHDLRAAEDFYRRFFEMELLFREGRVDGEWATLPADKGWDDAEAAGVELGMVALRREEFVLPLFQGAPAPGTVYEICIGLPVQEIEIACARLTIEGLSPGRHVEGRLLQFNDPFGYRWSLTPPRAPFLGSAEIAGRWLEV